MTKAKRIASLAAVVLVAAWAGTDALGADKAAGNFVLLRLQGQNVKWGAPKYGAPARVTYSLLTRLVHLESGVNCRSMAPLSSLPIDKAEAVRQIEDAFASWERQVGISFAHIADADSADILIGVQRKPRGIAYANVRREAHEGRLAPIRRAAICLNPEMRWETSLDGDPETPNVRYVIQHEVGHAIGLDHPGHDGAVMSYAYAEIYPDLVAGDIEGAAYLYGRRDAAAVDAPRPKLEQDEVKALGQEIALSRMAPVCDYHTDAAAGKQPAVLVRTGHTTGHGLARHCGSEKR